MPAVRRLRSTLQAKKDLSSCGENGGGLAYRAGSTKREPAPEAEAEKEEATDILNE
jgi:hypothetical protein